MARLLRLTWIGIALLSCATMPRQPIQTVAQVDLPRFMGDWYVIASIPTALERKAYNAVESYRLNEDGTVATTFSFHRGAFDGPSKTFRPRGWVLDSTHAVWGMQFLWPFKAQYLIAHLDSDYTETIIARDARDYVWIMARTPNIPPSDYARLVETVARMGYDPAKLVRVPQRW